MPHNNNATAIFEIQWWNAPLTHKLHAIAPDLHLLYLEISTKRLFHFVPPTQEDSESKRPGTLQLLTQFKTKTAMAKDLQTRISAGAFDLDACLVHPDLPPGIIFAHQCDQHPGPEPYSIHALNQAAPHPPGWTLLIDPASGKPCTYLTLQERQAAWQRLVVDNPKALED